VKTPNSFKIGELFKMDYSVVSQIAKRFEQKSKVNDKIKLAKGDNSLERNMNVKC